MSALRELTLSRFREFLREPEAVFWVFAFPVMLSCALGLAFRNQGTPDVLVGVLHAPATASTAPGVDAVLGRTAGVRMKVVSRAEADVALRNGAIHLLVVPGTPVTYEFDPSRPESRVARFVVDDALQRAAGRAPAVPVADRLVTVPGSRYIDWVVPGLLGMNIMGTGMWSVGFSVVQARVRKLLKRLVATPMRRRDYLLSHMASRLIFLVLEVGALLGFAVLVFGVPVHGSWLLLMALCLLGALTFSGLGLLVASRSQTVEGVSGLMNLVMVPMWVFSGVFFASENFPAVMQPAIALLPLTALNQALRGVMIDGSGLAALVPQVAVLGTWMVASFAAALRLFRWR
ncbi:transport permease protein [Luteitalea sp. TBR-22]|uniref:ABC transporter permease n=1 Tax=Luteitalea sp. TBR-22 TaxID=2802971 RepID=UPI001AFA7C52|nr:ABC transporter permease [Luteitalea sp. TBR-22]BCS33766.1 transport permease protein [Luteitalea sp. TBR-22]